jgi:hypothetical protein
MVRHMLVKNVQTYRCSSQNLEAVLSWPHDPRKPLDRTFGNDAFSYTRVYANTNLDQSVFKRKSATASYRNMEKAWLHSPQWVVWSSLSHTTTYLPAAASLTLAAVKLDRRPLVGAYRSHYSKHSTSQALQTIAVDKQ